MTWLLAEEALREMRRIERSGMVPSAAQQQAFVNRVESRSSPPNLTTAGSIAEIAVEGVLTKRPNFFASLFGGGNTSYSDIIAALSIAKNDPAVKSVVLRIDSPGGNIDGLFDVLAAIEDVKAKKPVLVRAANAQSAAFAIAAVGGKIEATGPSANFGSIGTAIDYVLWSDVEVVSITNTDSPDKRPDVKTEEGRAVVVKYLDAVNDLFVEAIAKGRGVTNGVVTKDYGRGATLLAGEAKRRGMIDSVARGFKFGGSVATSEREEERGYAERRASGYVEQREVRMETSIQETVATMTRTIDLMRACREGRVPLARAKEQLAAGAPLAGSSSITDSASRTVDVGDQVVELLRARRDGREPAAWAHQRLDGGASGTAGRTTTSGFLRTSGAAKDVGDLAAEIMLARRNGRGGARAGASGSGDESDVGARRTEAPPDVGDKVAELMLARRKNREPAAWALERG